jgi:hypothetical protein
MKAAVDLTARLRRARLVETIENKNAPRLDGALVFDRHDQSPWPPEAAVRSTPAQSRFIRAS